LQAAQELHDVAVPGVAVADHHSSLPARPLTKSQIFLRRIRVALGAPGDLLAFDHAVAACSWKVREESPKVILEWRSTAGELGLTASRAIEKATSQNLLFDEKLNGRSVPLVRLSEERLAPSS